MPFSSDATATGPAITSAAGKPIPCWGWQAAAVKFGGTVYQWKFLLAAVAFPLLGADFLASFKLVVDLHLFSVYKKGGKPIQMVAPPRGPMLVFWFWSWCHYTFTLSPSAQQRRLSIHRLIAW
jgi:hypothetical protein